MGQTLSHHVPALSEDLSTMWKGIIRKSHVVKHVPRTTETMSPINVHAFHLQNLKMFSVVFHEAAVEDLGPLCICNTPLEHDLKRRGRGTIPLWLMFPRPHFPLSMVRDVG